MSRCGRRHRCCPPRCHPRQCGNPCGAGNGGNFGCGTPVCGLPMQCASPCNQGFSGGGFGYGGNCSQQMPCMPMPCQPQMPCMPMQMPCQQSACASPCGGGWGQMMAGCGQWMGNACSNFASGCGNFASGCANACQTACGGGRRGGCGIGMSILSSLFSNIGSFCGGGGGGRCRRQKGCQSTC